jgi:hypothetical protein
MLTLRMPRISPGRRPAASAAASIRHRTAGISPVGMEPGEGIQLPAGPAVTASAHGPKAPGHTGIGPPGLGFMSRSRTLWWRPCWVQPECVQAPWMT